MNIPNKNMRLLYVFFVLWVLLFSPNNLRAQVRDWFRIYADDQASVARFDHVNFSINYNTWQHSLVDVKTQPYSFGFDFGIYKDIPISKRGNVTLGIGLNYGLVRVHHDADIVYVTDSVSGEKGTELIKTTDTYNRNRLLTSYLDLPIEFRFRTLGKNKFRFYPGFKAGVLLSVNNMRTSNTEKFKVYRIKNTGKFRYGPTLKIGYRNINLYGFYSLVPLFEGEHSVKINPITVGLSFYVL